jgi:hypothetical protein
LVCDLSIWYLVANHPDNQIANNRHRKRINGRVGINNGPSEKASITTTCYFWRCVASLLKIIL